MRTDKVALSTSTMTGLMGKRVVWREFVAVLAMCLCALLCGANYGNQPACHVHGMGDGFQMVRVNAASDAAFVVKFQSIRDEADEQFVGDDVGLTATLGIVPYLAVSVSVKTAHPNPASGFGDRHDVGKQPRESGRSSKLVFSHCDSPEIASVRAAQCFRTVAARSHYTPEVL